MASNRRAPVPRIFLLLLVLAPLCGPAAWGQPVPEWRPPHYPVPERAVRLRDRGVLPDTGQDVAARVSAVLATLQPGQTLYLDRGTYLIGATVLIPSGVALQGPQDRNGRPLAELVQTRPFGLWGLLNLGLLMNANYRANEIQDRGIRVTAVRFRHDSTGVLFRRVADVVIEGSTFEGGGDATAILAGRGSIVRHSHSTGTRNGAYDHWNGTEDATVTDSVALLATGHGILFNAVDTGNAPRTSRGFTARRNIIRGVGADSMGIWVSPLGRGGGRITGTITIENNDIAAPQPGARTGGILVRAGDADLVVVRGNRVEGALGYPAIAVGPNRAEEGGADRLPARVVVEGNDLRGNLVSRTGGVVRAWGMAVEVRGNRQDGNGFLGGGAAPAVTLCARSTPAQEPVAAGCAD